MDDIGKSFTGEILEKGPVEARQERYYTISEVPIYEDNRKLTNGQSNLVPQNERKTVISSIRTKVFMQCCSY